MPAVLGSPSNTKVAPRAEQAGRAPHMATAHVKRESETPKGRTPRGIGEGRIPEERVAWVELEVIEWGAGKRESKHRMASKSRRLSIPAPPQPADNASGMLPDLCHST